MDDEKIEKQKTFKLIKKDDQKDLKKFLKPTKADVTRSITKGLVSSIPVAGSFLGEIFDLTIPSPMSKRRDAIFTWFDQRLRALEEKGTISIESLKKDEEFLDFLIHAIQIAMRNFSQPLKMEAIQHAIVNNASKIINRNDAVLYLHYIDTLSTIQIQILQILSNPEKTIEQIYEMNRGNKGEITYIDVINDINKIVNVEQVLYDAAIRRLETDYLIDQTDKPPGPAKGGFYEIKLNFIQLNDLVIRTKNLITPFGKKFLEYISEH